MSQLLTKWPLELPDLMFLKSYARPAAVARGMALYLNVPLGPWIVSLNRRSPDDPALMRCAASFDALLFAYAINTILLRSGSYVELMRMLRCSLIIQTFCEFEYWSVICLISWRKVAFRPCYEVNVFIFLINKAVERPLVNRCFCYNQHDPLWTP